MKKIILFIAIVFAAGTFQSYAQHSDTLHPVADVFVYTWGGGQGGNAYLKFDISSLPENIVVSNARLEVNVFAKILPWDDDVKFINLNNQTWVEGDNGDMLWNSLKSDTIIQLNNFASGIGWTSSTNIAPILLRDYNLSHSFCTVLLKDPDDGTMGPQSGVPATDLNDSIVVGNIIMGFNGYIMFRPREYSDQSRIPMFIIDYGIAPLITSEPDSLVICDSTQVTFSVTATGDSLEYQWQKNGSDISGATSSAYTIYPATSFDDGNYRCIVSNSVGADTSNIALLTVNPYLYFDAGINDSICAGSCQGLNVIVSGGSSPYTYFWNPSQGLNDNGIPNPIACPLSSILYQVTVTDSQGCQKSDSVGIYVRIDIPTVNITATFDSICDGDCTDLTALPSGGDSPYVYFWNVSGETTQTINVCPDSTSSYYVAITDNNFCTASGNITVIVNVCTGISEYKNDDVNIQFIPNPFSTSAEINSDHYFNDAELNVYDILGNQVKDIKNISGNFIKIYRQGLPDGMYLYKLSEKNILIASGKFILN